MNAFRAFEGIWPSLIVPAAAFIAYLVNPNGRWHWALLQSGRCKLAGQSLIATDIEPLKKS
jgi:hypothetical protein